jgi:uncharacterized small protein (DUF1192 family)
MPDTNVDTSFDDAMARLDAEIALLEYENFQDTLAYLDAEIERMKYERFMRELFENEKGKKG